MPAQAPTGPENWGGVFKSRPLPTKAATWTTDRVITALAIASILVHLALRFSLPAPRAVQLAPLILTVVAGGIPLLYGLAREATRGEGTADLLAGISIVVACLMGEYLVGAIVVLMLAGGNALEQFATRRASSVLEALARRMPQVAHRRSGGELQDIGLHEVRVGDLLVVYPHEICPVDGVVVEGHGTMDEAYLTGEPYEITKTVGSAVLSGAVNGERAFTIRTEKLPVDSRYARIMQVMHETEQRRPRLRRLGDTLGAYYTPITLAIAGFAWATSGEAQRFLAVLVIATPCPLLIAIPVAVVGAISLAAERGIVVKNPAVLEQIDQCRVLIFDKTGTLTYGRPALVEIVTAQTFQEQHLLQLAGSLEVYSKHPLAGAILEAARTRGLPLENASEISERPGEGMRGRVGGHEVRLTGRRGVSVGGLPPATTGLECLLFVDGTFAAAFRFRDAPRKETRPFVGHLSPRHAVRKVMLVSGDREAEVRYLAEQVGIRDVHSGKTPEEKVEIVRAETASEKTLFVGDGINDAPAMQAATVGVAFGQASDIAAEAADAVVLEASLEKVDELIHIGRRMRRIALESAVGGMALSVAGMAFAASGHLPPVAGAIGQEAIDLVAVLNALRMVLPAGRLTDF